MIAVQRACVLYLAVKMRMIVQKDFSFFSFLLFFSFSF
nr:MAG TPA: hypothetical protein [Caudoviricetes sp.]